MLSEKELVQLHQYFIDFLSGIFMSSIVSVTVSEIDVRIPARLRVQFTIHQINAEETHSLLQKFPFVIEPRFSQFQNDLFIVDFVVDGDYIPMLAGRPW